MTSIAYKANVVEQLLKRDRSIVFASISLLTTLSWIYLFYLVSLMDMGGMAMSGVIKLAPWTAIDTLFMFLMWVVMMIGMMLPSATPVILLYARVVRHNAKHSEPLVATGAFLTGYVVVWTRFSAFATVLQFGLEQAALLSPLMISISPLFAGSVLLIAAFYQWTPYKNACLRRCRSPVWFLSTCWRDGADGALRMGLSHGAYCLGCCWALMLLLFVGGVMNLLCIAAITIFVLIEKVLPGGRGFGRVAAVFAGFLGIFLIVG